MEPCQIKKVSILIEQAERTADNGNFFLTSMYLNEAKDFAQQVRVELPDLKKIQNKAYKNGLKKNLEEANNYAINTIGKEILKRIEEKFEGADYCSQKLGINIENNKRAIIQKANLVLNKNYLEFANKFLQNKKHTPYKSYRAKAVEHAYDSKQDIIAELSLMDICERNTDQMYKENNTGSQKGPIEKIILN